MRVMRIYKLSMFLVLAIAISIMNVLPVNLITIRYSTSGPGSSRGCYVFGAVL
jgi:hypothetical protein